MKLFWLANFIALGIPCVGFFGDHYLAKIAEQQELIKKGMIKYQCDEINATMKIVELLQQKVPDSGTTQALFIAACVEPLEPSSS